MTIASSGPLHRTPLFDNLLAETRKAFGLWLKR